VERSTSARLGNQGANFVRVAAWICFLCLFAAGLTGCSSFNKKNGSTAPPAGGPGGVAPPKFPSTTDPILNTTSGAHSGHTIIAGRVLDEYGRPAANTYVRLVAVGEKDAATPVDIATSNEGYFTIPGLKQGADYKLIARAKTGEKMIAGQTQTSAPNVHIVIKMRKDLVGATTPDLPAPVGESKGPEKTARTLGTPEPLPAWKPGNGSTASISPDPASPRLSLEQELPAVKVPTPGPIPPPPSATPGFVDKGATWPPALSIPPPAIPRPDVKPLIPAVTPPPSPATGSTLGAARVPSCVLVGKQLINFALNDINGEPWEFKSNRQGKLILLDFWGTGCIHCRETLPFLKQLDQKYRGQGLEIIGLAYESSGSPQEQAYRVSSVMKGQGVTYRQLLGAGGTCPVRGQFGVRFIPTLVLLDENGWILWRHQGRPDRASLDELERWIQRRLPVKGM